MRLASDPVRISLPSLASWLSPASPPCCWAGLGRYRHRCRLVFADLVPCLSVVSFVSGARLRWSGGLAEGFRLALGSADSGHES